MKKILVLAAMLGLCSANAFAMGGKSLADQSWSELRANKTVQINGPLVALKYGTIFNMCVEGNNFRSIADVKTCTLEPIERRDGGEGNTTYTDWVCKAGSETSVPVGESRDHIEEYCVVYNENYGREGDSGEFCKVKGTRPATYPTTFNLDILVDHGGEAGAQYAGSKSYEIQPCVK